MKYRLAMLMMVALIAAIVGRTVWIEMGDPDAISRYVLRVREMGWLGYCLLACGYATVALLPIPLMPLTALGGYLMGFWFGLIWLWPAAVISACISHYFGARFLVGTVPQILERFPKAKFLCGEAVESDWVAVAVNRLLPVCPFAIQNVLLGAIGLPVRAQFIGTALGILPALGFALYCGSIAQALTEVLTDPAKLMPAGQIALLLLSVMVGLSVLIWIRRRLLEQRSIL